MAGSSESTVLIAGGAGFIGSHLCDHCLTHGFSVVCIDDLCTGAMQNIAHLLGDQNFAFRRGDVCEMNFEEFRDLDISFVIHLASPASPADYMRLPVKTMTANTLGTQRLLEFAGATSSSFLFASTSEVYGDPVVHPQSEKYWGNVNPIGPRAVYDESKRMGETIVAHYQRNGIVDTRIARIFNTYGPRMRLDDGRVIVNLVRQAVAGQPMTLYGGGSRLGVFSSWTT